MSQLRSIDNIILKVTRSYQERGSDEVVFRIHKDRREIVQNNPFFPRDDEYYRISLSGVAQGKLPYRISELSSESFIDLLIDYEVRCPNLENAKTVVLTLQGAFPLETLEQNIKIWIDQFVAGSIQRYVSDLDACFAGIRSIQEDIRRKVGSGFGLDFKSKVTIAGISQFNAFTIQASGLDCSIKDFSSGKQRKITLDYQATCAPHNIEKAVLTLYNSASVKETLNAKVKQWVNEFAQDKTAIYVIENFDLEVGNLKLKLREKAKAEVGLDFEARLSSDFQERHNINPEALKPYKTGAISIPLRLKDYDQELELQIEAILEVDQRYIEQAFNLRGREFLLLNSITPAVEAFFQQISLRQFCIELQSTVRARLEETLNNQVLAPKGRRLGYFSLYSQSIDEIRDRFNLTPFLEIQRHLVECSLQDSVELIQVRNFISLELFDLSRYRAAVASRLIPLDASGKPDLERWVKQRLEREIKAILPNEKFYNLLREFEPIVSSKQSGVSNAIISVKQPDAESKRYSQKIFDALKAAAQEIGYVVTRLISEPELKVREKFALQEFEFLQLRDFEIRCPVKGFKEIRVNNTLYLQIVDVWKYSLAVKTKQIPLTYADGKPNLKEWAKFQIERIVRNLLLETEYVSLIPESGLEAYSAAVLERIRSAADEIGYEVINILSIPEVEESQRLRETFTVETGEKEYSTKDAYCPVKLRTTVEMRIDKPEEIGERLKRISETPLNDQIRNRIDAAISRTLRDMEPERFFMRFDIFNSEEGETKSVEALLREAIAEELKAHFKAEIISISPILIDTDLKKLFDALQGAENTDFEFEFEPIGDGEQVRIFGAFQVRSVAENDWNKFRAKFRGALNKREDLLKLIEELEQRRKDYEKEVGSNPKREEDISRLRKQIQALQNEACGIDLIRRNIEADCRSIFHRRSINEFRYASKLDWLHVQNVMNTWLQEDAGSTKDLYGLIVQVSRVDGDVTETEEGKADKQREIGGIREELALIDVQIKELNQQVLDRTKEITSSPRAMRDIKTLKEYIQELKGQKRELTQELDSAKQSKQDRQIKGGSIPLLRDIPSRRMLAPGDQAVKQPSEASPHPPQSNAAPQPTSSQTEDQPITIDTDAKPIQDD
ncbi:hypothetical protein [Almyronema epifaneia]|uniref:DUF2357 domain-containing protein n=1 Tax=Almyronema epifaneia S1 TaxID=2991925 RepID=A0ABW6ICR9_9CYAN